jgi:magnesium transporter
MIHSLFRPTTGPLQKELSIEQIQQALTDPTGLVWVSLEHTTPDEILAILVNLFHFHPLAVEDCQSTGYQTPKVDDFIEYLFLITHALESHHDLEEFTTKELNSFLGKNYLVTSYQEADMSCIQAVWKRIEKDERILSHGPDFLMHAILDALVDEYMPLLDELDENIEQLEDEVVKNPRQQILTRILALKHSLMVLRRTISPQREVMNRLSRDDFPQIDRASRIYYRDIYDHTVRFQDLIESLRDIVGDALSTYLSATSNRLNEVMKALTIVSTIFLPLTFIAGVYGMNFQNMPELRSTWGYPVVWGVFIVIVVGMLAFFKKRGWI